jgi:multidrug efflux pump subunit AcrA (membrane-fusion protein)
MEKLSRNPIRNYLALSKFTPGMAKTAAAAALIASLLSGCSLLPAEEQQLQPPLVKPAQEKFDVVEVKKGTIQTFLKGTANFIATERQSLFFTESGGRVNAVHVNLGQEVKAGDLLIDLITGDLDLQAKLQKLNVEKAQILYQEAKKSGAGASEIRLRQIDLEHEQISQDEIDKQMAKSRLVSPLNGIVTYIGEIKAGDSVNAYSPLISIDDPSHLQLAYQAVNGKDLYPVQPGMPVTLTYKKQELTGKVLQTPSTAPLSADKTIAERNAVTLILSIDKPPAGISIGESVDFTVPLQKQENVIVLPRAGLRSYLGRDYVQIAEGERRKEVDVEVGLKTATEVEIVRGLEVGQEVILNN